MGENTVLNQYRYRYFAHTHTHPLVAKQSMTSTDECVWEVQKRSIYILEELVIVIPRCYSLSSPHNLNPTLI